jgi:hypothetical protein
MDDKVKQIESLLESVAEYGKTSYELAKLKLLDKSSDAVSSFIPHAAVFTLASVFLIFLNLGLAFWLGEILGSIYFGFFAVASFYGIFAIVFHFFLHKWLKKVISNYIINNVAK